MDDNRVIDFAIVGGGVAGIYTALRVARAKKDELKTLVPSGSRRPIVRLFEASDRLGGRLYTEPMPDLPPHRAELGGMRYTEHQLLVTGLVRFLDLTPREFLFPTLFMSLRGCHLRRGSGRAAQRLPYNLYADESRGIRSCQFGQEGAALVKRAIRSALLDLADERKTRAIRRELTAKLLSRTSGLNRSVLTTSEWDLLKRYAVLNSAPRAHLYELGFWNLLRYYLSQEAYSLVHDALGYESIVANWNAAEAIQWFLADMGVEKYFTLDEGMSALPEKLDFLLKVRDPQSKQVNHELKGIVVVDNNGERLLKLSFQVSDHEECVERLARHVIIALPQGALMELFDSKNVDVGGVDSDFANYLRAVTAHSLFKLFLGYERAWWATSGKAITDSPLRQVYYFPPDRKTGSGMIMASYSDERYVEFWSPIMQRGGPNYCTYPRRPAIVDVLGAPEPLVAKAGRQLRELHPDLSSVPQPCIALMRPWSTALRLYHGGWHTWNPHAKPWEVMNRLKRPFRGINLYICGEAYSPEQGWVEGALKSAEMVAKELRLGPPDWVGREDYGDVGYDDYIRS